MLEVQKESLHTCRIPANLLTPLAKNLPATPLQHPEFAAPHSTPSPPHLNCGESPTTRTLVLSFYPAFFLEENGPKKLTLHYVFAFQKLLKILPTINTYLTVKFHASLGKQFWDTALS